MGRNWKAEKKLNEETSVAPSSDNGDATTEKSKGHSMKSGWKSEKKLNEETFGASSSVKVKGIFYDKKKSFFDSISYYGAGTTTEKCGWRSEKELNEENGKKFMPSMSGNCG